VHLEALRAMRKRDRLSDEAMVAAIRSNLLDPAAPNPSIETLLHAWIPARFVDHTHADAVLALADQPEGRKIFTQLFGKGLVWVPYVMPGFALAKRCAQAFDEVAAQAQPELIVLEKHGLITWGETAKESYERTIEAVSRAELYAADRSTTVALTGGGRVDAPETVVLPRLRGALAKLASDAPERGPVVRTRSTQSVLTFLERPDAPELVSRGCITPDHVIRTKPTALFVPKPVFADPEKLSSQLQAAVAEYARKYDAYFEEQSRAKKVHKTRLDPWPRVVLLPGFGICAVADTAREADIALDIYEHTIDVMTVAAEVGSYAPCSRAEMFDFKFWTL
jgi:rhamnose utilization protein RhaD (predicted bifunctional aldolase and dehydrogenase)